MECHKGFDHCSCVLNLHEGLSGRTEITHQRVQQDQQRLRESPNEVSCSPTKLRRKHDKTPYPCLHIQINYTINHLWKTTGDHRNFFLKSVHQKALSDHILWCRISSINSFGSLALWLAKLSREIEMFLDGLAHIPYLENMWLGVTVNKT